MTPTYQKRIANRMTLRELGIDVKHIPAVYPRLRPARRESVFRCGRCSGPQQACGESHHSDEIICGYCYEEEGEEIFVRELAREQIELRNADRLRSSKKVKT